MSPYTIPEETLLNLVNAAKAFKRAKTAERRLYWAKRLLNRVTAYEEAEAMIKQRFKEPAYVEIETAVLVCSCGHRTEVPGNEMGLVGQPLQRCEGCNRQWWTSGAADCEEPTL